MNVKQTDLIRKAGLLHDIGKLGVPIETLSKEVELSPGEKEPSRSHAALGVALVRNSPSLRPIAHVIRHHHERFDGNGYPDQIAGNQISIEARIIAVADAIESMMSDRPYRRAFTLDKVKTDLQKGSGHQFDPLVVDAAIKMLEQVASNQAAQATQLEPGPDLPARLATDPRAA
jgi:putative nucleotidyltransferase with HDIG domain